MFSVKVFDGSMLVCWYSTPRKKDAERYMDDLINRKFDFGRIETPTGRDGGSVMHSYYRNTIEQVEAADWIMPQKEWSYIEDEIRPWRGHWTRPCGRVRQIGLGYSRRS